MADFQSGLSEHLFSPPALFQPFWIFARIFYSYDLRDPRLDDHRRTLDAGRDRIDVKPHAGNVPSGENNGVFLSMNSVAQFELPIMEDFP